MKVVDEAEVDVDECHGSAVAYGLRDSSLLLVPEKISSVRILELLRSGRIRDAIPLMGRSRSSLTVGSTGLRASCLISTVGKMATFSLWSPRFSSVMMSSTELVSS